MRVLSMYIQAATGCCARGTQCSLFLAFLRRQTVGRAFFPLLLYATPASTRTSGARSSLGPPIGTHPVSASGEIQ